MLVGLLWKLDHKQLVDDVRQATLAYKRRMIGQPVYVIFNRAEAPLEGMVCGLKVYPQDHCLKGHIIIYGGNFEPGS